MANLNKVLLIGNLTRDPELKQLASQTFVCEFGLAVNRTWTGQDGVKKEETTFVDCSAFGKQAELLAKYKKKGDPLFVEGRLKLDQWEAQDGSKRSKMRVVIENFQFLNRGQAGGYNNAPAGDPGEYAGEPQAAPARQPYRAAGRPNAGPSAARPAPAAPVYDADVPSVPEDEGTHIKEDDIPF
jgi:single-strand DNA-binding protein